jgi:hypothetical protein
MCASDRCNRERVSECQCGRGDFRRLTSEGRPDVAGAARMAGSRQDFHLQV